MLISDWSSDVCSSDLGDRIGRDHAATGDVHHPRPGDVRPSAQRRQGPVRFRYERGEGVARAGGAGAGRERAGAVHLARDDRGRAAAGRGAGRLSERGRHWLPGRTEGDKSELPSLKAITFCRFRLKKKKNTSTHNQQTQLYYE